MRARRPESTRHRGQSGPQALEPAAHAASADTADCSEFAKGAKRAKKSKKSKKSKNAEAGWVSSFRCLRVLDPQQIAINRRIRAQWTFLRGIDDTCEMWMRSGAEIGRPDLRLRSSGTDCEWHL